MAAEGLQGSCGWAFFWAAVVAAGALAEAAREASG
jgi:hypothetical protein